MFPGPGAQIYYNEAGEPLGWDYPSSDPPELDPYEEARIDAEYEHQWDCDYEAGENAFADGHDLPEDASDAFTDGYNTAKLADRDPG